MRKINSLILLLSLFTILFTNSQNKELIHKNLNYINNQFNLYNKYQTSWAIDYKTDEIYCFDEFGSLKANISDIIFEDKEGKSKILNLKCIDNSTCITESNSGKQTKNSYSMGLSKNLLDVLNKFNEIKREYNNSSTTNSSNKYSNSVKESVNDILKRVTEIFNTENKYKNKWYVNWDKNYFYGKTKSCEVHIPFGQNIKVERTNRGYKFISSKKNIREKCRSFDDLNTITYENLNSESAKDEVIYLFNEIFYLTK